MIPQPQSVPNQEARTPAGGCGVYTRSHLRLTQANRAGGLHQRDRGLTVQGPLPTEGLRPNDQKVNLHHQDGWRPPSIHLPTRPVTPTSVQASHRHPDPNSPNNEFSNTPPTTAKIPLKTPPMSGQQSNRSNPHTGARPTSKQQWHGPNTGLRRNVVPTRGPSSAEHQLQLQH